MDQNIQREVSDFVQRNIVTNVSVLFSDVMRLLADAEGETARSTSLDYDELLGLQTREAWETPGKEHIRTMDRDDLLGALDIDSDDARNDLDADLRMRLTEKLDDGCDDAWRDFCVEQNVDPEHDEVYEHWAVDPWFGARLKAHGEVVGDFGNLTVWGRCTTGQAISMDFVVEEIYKETML